MSIKNQWKRIKRKAAGTATGIKHRIDTAIAMLVVSILAAKLALDIINTIAGTIGVIFLAVSYLMNPDAFKQNSKILIGAIAVIAILYAITRMGLSAFN